MRRLALLLSLLAAPAAAQPLTIALQTDLASLGPHVAPSFTGAVVQAHVYGALSAMDAWLSVVPDLATAWRVEGHTAREFDLR